MHVVLSGYYGFNNCGDEAILYSVVQALRNIQPEVKITVLSNNPALTKRLYHVNSVHRTNLRMVNQVIKESDGLISGGGSLLQDKTGMKSIPYYSGIIQLAKWHKKPVFIYAQGMGPISRPLGKWMVRHTLNKVENITVRDTDSQQLLQEIGIKQQTKIVPDPVLGLQIQQRKIDLDSADRPFVAVSVRDWQTEIPYKKLLANSLDQLAAIGYEILFVPMHGKHDEKASKETAQMMDASSEIFSEDATIEEKIGIIGQAKLLIGMRLHSLIFSAINYTPFIAVSYDPKIDAFAEICDQKVIGHVEQDDWDSGTLSRLAKEILENEAMYRKDLKERITPYQEDASKTPFYAIEAIQKGR